MAYPTAQRVPLRGIAVTEEQIAALADKVAEAVLAKLAESRAEQPAPESHQQRRVHAREHGGQAQGP